MLASHSPGTVRKENPFAQSLLVIASPFRPRMPPPWGDSPCELQASFVGSSAVGLALMARMVLAATGD